MHIFETIFATILLQTYLDRIKWSDNLGPSLICWCSTDQGSISTSTAESEIKAVNHTLKAEVIANRGMLSQMGWLQAPTRIEEDNKACVDAPIISHASQEDYVT